MVSIFNIIHSVHCYCDQTHTPKNTQNLYKVTWRFSILYQLCAFFGYKDDNFLNLRKCKQEMIRHVVQRFQCLLTAEFHIKLTLVQGRVIALPEHGGRVKQRHLGSRVWKLKQVLWLLYFLRVKRKCTINVILCSKRAFVEYYPDFMGGEDNPKLRLGHTRPWVTPSLGINQIRVKR